MKHVPQHAESGAGILKIEGPQQVTALEVLVNPTPTSSCRHGEAFLRYAEQAKISLDGLWSMVDPDGKTIVASVLTVPSPGGSAMVFCTKPLSPQQARRHAVLIRKACTDLPSKGVALAQVILEKQAKLEQQMYLQAGFQRLSDLAYLERPLKSKRGLNLEGQWPDDCTLHPWDPSERLDWERALDRSYEDTLDCPGLVGLRATADVLDGHYGTGTFEGSLWTLLRIDGAPAGVLLLSPTPASDSIELVYLGLAPEARGRGLASRLLSHGFELLSGRDEQTISLAVDERNEPAIRLYRSVGFRSMWKRVAFIQSLKTP